MAIRLFEASSLSLARIVTAQDAANISGGFQCGCGARVTHVEGHIKFGDDARLRREIPSFFRLATNESHQENCQYNVRCAVDYLIRQARSVEGTVDPFESNSDVFRFRLNIPMLLASAGGRVVTKGEFVERLQTAWSSGQLDNYCRSAVGLAKIWNSIEGDNSHRELRNIVTIGYAGHEIPWLNFCFAATRYGKLANLLFRGDSNHPMAVLVVVSQINVTKNGGLKIDCVPAPISNANRDVRVAPVIFAPTELQGTLIIGQQYIVFGNWRPGRETPWPVPDTDRVILYRGLTLDMKRRAQIGKIAVPGEGE